MFEFTIKTTRFTVAKKWIIEAWIFGQNILHETSNYFDSKCIGISSSG